MNKRYSYKQLSNLWSDTSSIGFTKNVIASRESNEHVIKAIDDLCLKADLAESVEEYSLTLCKGMKNILGLGGSTRVIQSHHNLISKILYFGRDLCEGSGKFSQMFYLGLFIDIKIASKWLEKSFYSFIIKAIRFLKRGGTFISNELKKQLIGLYSLEDEGSKNLVDLYQPIKKAYG